MGASKRIHPLPPPPPPPPRRCVMRSQCDRCCLRFMPVLMDRAARSPFHQKRGARRGPRGRQCASAAPHGNLPCGAALAAARQQSYGCAYSDVRWRSTSTTFNIITITTTHISHGGCRNVFASGGFVCLFGSLLSRYLRSSDMDCECNGNCGFLQCLS